MDLSLWRRTLIEGWTEEVSSDEEVEASSPLNNNVVTSREFGPLYGEDEDLAKAIALSLAEQNLVQTSARRNGGTCFT